MTLDLYNSTLIIHLTSNVSEQCIGIDVKIPSDVNWDVTRRKMVNECLAPSCQTGKEATNGEGEKVYTFHFLLEDQEICDKWKYFVGRLG